MPYPSSRRDWAVVRPVTPVSRMLGGRGRGGSAEVISITFSATFLATFSALAGSASLGSPQRMRVRSGWGSPAVGEGGCGSASVAGALRIGGGAESDRDGVAMG